MPQLRHLISRIFDTDEPFYQAKNEDDCKYCKFISVWPFGQNRYTIIMAGIYIHIPYCHSKCAYCDFYSIPSHKSEPALISDAIIQEWDYRKNEKLPNRLKPYI